MKHVWETKFGPCPQVRTDEQIAFNVSTAIADVVCSGCGEHREALIYCKGEWTAAEADRAMAQWLDRNQEPCEAQVAAVTGD